MSTAINLLGQLVKQRLKVWYHNAEDSQQEVERRILAICQYYSIEQSELDGWFLATSCELFDLHVARGYNEVKADDALIAAMCNKIAELEIDVVILDPLVNLHDVPEGGNSQMNHVISVFRSIAQSQNCAVEIEQHTRKQPVGMEVDYTGADARGASSVRDAYRAQRVLNHPTKEEARAHGIADHERGLFVRVDVGEANNSRPGPPVWRRLVTTTLPNGDDIGVMEAWHPPGQGPDTPETAAANAQAESVFMQLLARFISQGRLASDGNGKNYARSLFAEEPEARKAKLSKAALAAAMRRLFSANKICVNTTTSHAPRTRCLAPV